MRWKFRLIEKSERFYIYAYSRESAEMDGQIIYDKEKDNATIMKPATIDKTSVKAQSKALEHFYTVIEKGFPDELYVCCG